MTTPHLTVLSLGAGVQSSTLYLMALQGELAIDAAIFADTGWEPQAVYRHLAWLETLDGPPLYRVSAGNLRQDLLETVAGTRARVSHPPLYVRDDDPADPGGQLWRSCTKAYKIVPIVRQIRALLQAQGLPSPRQGARVSQVLGISLDELHRASPSRVRWITVVWPLLARRMTRQDCLTWLRRHGYPLPPKSSCLGCPYHSNAHWLQMQRTQPDDEWASTVAVDTALRQGSRLPSCTGQVYLHRSMRPLQEAIDALDTGQGQFDFLNECDGVCFT